MLSDKQGESIAPKSQDGGLPSLLDAFGEFGQLNDFSEEDEL
jgi:hypothetical protein